MSCDRVLASIGVGRWGAEERRRGERKKGWGAEGAEGAEGGVSEKKSGERRGGGGEELRELGKLRKLGELRKKSSLGTITNIYLYKY
ncbi:MAG: hypothetical protein F6J96_18220 [Symploca sp. SIO1C2]|nr:hypothetical protein [Symploca sp. SIO1C2]